MSVWFFIAVVGWCLGMSETGRISFLGPPSQSTTGWGSKQQRRILPQFWRLNDELSAGACSLLGRGLGGCSSYASIPLILLMLPLFVCFFFSGRDSIFRDHSNEFSLIYIFKNPLPAKVTTLSVVPGSPGTHPILDPILYSSTPFQNHTRMWREAGTGES